MLYQTTTFLIAIGTLIGLIAMTGICLGKYPCEEMPSCSLSNHVITIIILVLGHLILITNIVSVFAINIKLLDGCNNMISNRLGFIEAYKELFQGDIFNSIESS